VFGIRGPDAGEAAVRELLAGPRPTALFSAQNLITIGAVRGLRNLGLRHEIALVGLDDFALADLLEPLVVPTQLMIRGSGEIRPA
jgi:LacI family transcriptional regulator